MSDAHRTAFVHESQEGITELNNALLALEGDPEDEAAMDSIFRTAHTLKGNAAAMGYDQVSDLAHAMEDLLDEVRAGEIAVTTDLMDLLFDGVDHLDAMIGQIQETGEATIEVDELKRQLRAIAEGEASIGNENTPIDNADGGQTDESTDDVDGESTDGVDGESTDDVGPETSNGERADSDVEVHDTDTAAEVHDTDTDVEVSDTSTDVDGENGSVPETVAAAIEDGEAFCRATVSLGDASMPGVDAMFLLGSLEDDYDPIVTDPPREQVEDGEFDETFDLFVPAESAAAVEERVGSQSDVEAVSAAMIGARSKAGDEPEAGSTDENDIGDENDAVGGDDSIDDAGDGRGDIDDAGDERGDIDDAGNERDIGDDGEAVTEDDGEAVTEDDETADSAAVSSGSPAADRGGDIASVRVDVDQLDDLYSLVEQLVTSRIKLRREMEEAGLDSDNLDELDKITANLQNTAMDMRLIPLSKVVDTFPRIVRDVARDTGKDVDFSVSGADIELDRTILTEIRDPLIHILRNAVDHGIEPPEEREAAGKPPTGTVTLTATRERDHVTIEVEDDGAGLDADQLRRKAKEKGVKTEAELESMADDEVYDLIFHPGFSTAQEVTDVSGRGVGMDVVHTTVKQLDGTVSVDSEPGEGTVVRLRLPVTVAIVKVMFVEVGGTEYGIPVKNIAEVTRATEIHSVNGDEIIKHDDDIYPVLKLGDVLEESARKNGDGMLLRIRQDKRQVALHCDAVLDQEEVVVKPLEGVLSGIPGLSGTAVLGDGDVVAVLDVVTL